MKINVETRENTLICTIFTQNHYENMGFCAVCNKFDHTLEEEATLGLCSSCSAVLRDGIIDHIWDSRKIRVENLENYISSENLDIQIRLTNILEINYDQ